MAYKTPGPCTLLREHLAMQATSYSTASSIDSDDFRYNSTISGYPSSQSHVVDSTAYSTQPTLDSWQVWIAGGNQV